MSAVKTAAAQRRVYKRYAGAQKRAQAFVTANGYECHILRFPSGLYYVAPIKVDELLTYVGETEGVEVVSVVVPFSTAFITRAIGKPVARYVRFPRLY